MTDAQSAESADVRALADVIREKADLFVADGFRDDGGVWHDGPHRVDLESALNGLLDAVAVAKRERDEAQEVLRDVVSQFNMWSEDANDGEFAYWRSDGLMMACVKARAYLAGVGS